MKIPTTISGIPVKLDKSGQLIVDSAKAKPLQEKRLEQVAAKIAADLDGQPAPAPAPTSIHQQVSTAGTSQEGPPDSDRSERIKAAVLKSFTGNLSILTE